MSTITFDKLAYIETLKASGVPEAQARAHTLALDDALKDSVATKQDIMTIRHDIEKLGSSIEKMKLELTVRFSSMLFVGFGALIAAMRFMLPH